MTDTYDDSEPLPLHWNTGWEGPKGLALVRAWPDGRTDVGWGINPPPNSTEGFMPRYMRGEFNARRVLFGFNRDRWNFAIVMRSINLVCIDIDGKNGGLDEAKKLGALPPTLAETSKSGDGYHLFYTGLEQWDLTTGFAELNDRIGIEQGVDFRATGCVYHHKQQRWNDRDPAPLPMYLYDLIKAKSMRAAASNARITTVLASGDDMEVLMLHDEILTKLAKPIAAGKRNNTLFAIGSEMLAAGIPNWDVLLIERAEQIGLDDAEIAKLPDNIKRYAASTP
jgi:hypothetical protein